MPTHMNGFVVFGAIEQKWLALGGAGGPLGVPTSNEAPTFDGVGRTQGFAAGLVAWHPEIGAFAVWGAIGARWLQIGRERYGYPITDELATPDGRGRFNHFRAMHLPGRPEASIYWIPEAGAHEVYGAIRHRWALSGWETGPLGYPVGPEGPGEAGGRVQPFQGGFMAWHPELGAHMVQGLIAVRWRQVGATAFGYPLDSELPTRDGVGRFNHFRAMHLPGRPEASIYWHPATGAHEVYGAIRQKWAAADLETGPLVFPVGPETPAVGGGRVQGFQGGTIAWHPETGAHIVLGAIGQRWHQLGGPAFGYPLADEQATPDGGGRYTHFRAMHLNGRPDASIYWHPQTGAHEVYGAIRDRWARRGWERSTLGYPIGPEQDRTDGPGREQRFQFGRIVWTPAGGALCDPLAFTARLVTGGAAALGGWVTVTLSPDGSVRFQGHAHNSGMDGYDFSVSTILKAPSGQAIALAHSGRVGGTIGAGSRDHDWDEPGPPSAIVRNNFLAFNDAELGTHLEYSSDIGGALEDVLSWAVRWSIGSAIGAIGPIVFVGLALGSLLETGSAIPGVRLAEGILWMAGPANTLFAIAAAGIADAGSRSREVTQAEYDWANELIFHGSLPARDRLIVTDTIGGGNRAFVFPRYDGKITMNMGAARFDRPSLVGDPVFVHELVHTLQVDRSTDLGTLADAMAAKLCEATGGNPYAYGPAGPDFTEFNIEAQAKIVQDWFTAGCKTDSPYFRYIVENIRTGRV